MSRPPSQIDGYGIGRVYLIGFDPDTEQGPHPGYRGLIRVTEVGVFLEAGMVEWVMKKGDGSEWLPIEHHSTVPLSQVELIEWDDKHEIGAA